LHTDGIVLALPHRLERRLRNHRTMKVVAIGQGLAQESDERTAVIDGNSVGVDGGGLLVLAETAAAGQSGSCHCQDHACTMSTHARSLMKLRSWARFHAATRLNDCGPTTPMFPPDYSKARCCWAQPSAIIPSAVAPTASQYSPQSAVPALAAYLRRAGVRPRTSFILGPIADVRGRGPRGPSIPGHHRSSNF
jgi:hypothetical protein